MSLALPGLDPLELHSKWTICSATIRLFLDALFGPGSRYPEPVGSEHASTYSHKLEPLYRAIVGTKIFWQTNCALDGIVDYSIHLYSNLLKSSCKKAVNPNWEIKYICFVVGRFKIKQLLLMLLPGRFQLNRELT